MVIDLELESSFSISSHRLPEFEATFTPSDPENPRNWPHWYRIWCITTVSFASWIIVLYSTSYSSSIPWLEEEFQSTKSIILLGMTTYLLGLAVGCFFAAPLSELVGRRPVYLLSLCLWALFIIPCAVAKSFSVILISRFIGAFFGAALISNGPGTVVDVCNPKYLAKGMSLFSIGPFNGPVLGPLIGGFIFEKLGWRWTNWVMLILAGISLAMMLTIKETYTPEILKQRAARVRNESGDPRWWSRYETTADQKSLQWRNVCDNLMRPVILFFTEPIVWFINIWNAVIYGILYLSFVAYPIIFSVERHWSPGMSGMSYLGIGVGIMLAIASEPLLRRLINMQACDPLTGRPYPESAALVMVIGSVLTPLGQLGFSWTCLPTEIHWLVPIAFGVPYGAGNTLSFIYSSNYLAASYGIYAASALASNAIIRSIFGAILPLASLQLYKVMSPQWAGTLCGILTIAMIPIPIILWKFGSRIRSKSRTIVQLCENN